MIISVDAAREALRKDPRIPLLITVVFAFLMIISLAQMIKTLTFNENDSITALPHSAVNIRHQQAHIAQFHLFGVYDESLAELPPTQLQLTLEGIGLGVSPGEISRVLIEGPNTPTKIYKVGDIVPGGAVIRHIFRDRIILNDNGRLESLKLPVPKISGVVTSASE